MKIQGIEVVDADKPVVLHIRDADTKTGKKDPEKCAAAKAACRIPGVVEARVYRTRTFLLMQNKQGKKQWKRYQTPDSIRNEVIAFDRGGSFEPDDYVMKPVAERDRLGATYKRYKPGKRKGKRPTPHVVKGIRPLGPHGPGDKK